MGAAGQFSFPYDGGGRRGVEERGSTADGGCGGPQRDAAAVGPGDPTQQQRRHAIGEGVEGSDLVGEEADQLGFSNTHSALLWWWFYRWRNESGG